MNWTNKTTSNERKNGEKFKIKPNTNICTVGFKSKSKSEN